MSGTGGSRILVSLLLVLLAPGAAGAKGRSILVIGPHPDDEALIAAGRVRSAVLAGDTVHLVVVTNGDLDGKSVGLNREGESVSAADLLGVPESAVVFLGYGDQTLHPLWTSTDPDKVVTSPAKQSATYGERGFGGKDFHSAVTGRPAPYTRRSVLEDFQTLITRFRPDEVYTVSDRDNHGDHAGTARFLHQALVELERAGKGPIPRVFESAVWAPYANGDCTERPWPGRDKGPLPYPPFPPPPCIVDDTALDWSQVRRFPVPPEMLAPEPSRNLKHRVLVAYHSQFSDFLASFVRRDEFFWVREEPTDLTPLARVSVSSESSEGDGGREHAVDGFADIEHEWKSGDAHGAWIQLDWPEPVRLGLVRLWDRLDRHDNVLAGTLSFSDGSTVEVPALPPTGKPLPVTFSPRTVSWVRFTIDRSEGYNPGLAEIEAHGASARGTGNLPPQILRGPMPAASSVPAGQPLTLSVEAADLDGDPLQYAWATTAGSIAGKGASAVLASQGLAPGTVCVVTVTVSDGRGGVDRNSAFVTVAGKPRR